MFKIGLDVGVGVFVRVGVLVFVGVVFGVLVLVGVFVTVGVGVEVLLGVGVGVPQELFEQGTLCTYEILEPPVIELTTAHPWVEPVGAKEVDIKLPLQSKYLNPALLEGFVLKNLTQKQDGVVDGVGVFVGVELCV